MDFNIGHMENGQPSSTFIGGSELLGCGKLLPPPVRSFQSREEQLEYVHTFSFSQGYATSIKDSEKDKYVTIGCDRGGKYRNRVNTPIEERKRKTSSWLNCPFQIKGLKQVDGSWILLIQNADHNHEASIDMSGHPSFRRFSKGEVLRIKEMSKSGIPPRQMLNSLWQANPNLQATFRNVYNTKAKIHNEELGGRTPIQALLEELSTGGFEYNVKYDTEGRLTHLFFAHPWPIKLSRNYSNVFVMDCTYKTNRFKMPLLDIIGVSSFNSSFYSGFAIVYKEEKMDYVWALDSFKKILGSNEPAVIVSDKELALVNATEIVFPSAKNIIRFWHIEKNILSHRRKHFPEEKDLKCFLDRWDEVVKSDSEVSFDDSWTQFETSYKEKVVLVDYIRNTWLPLKRYFVRAWTDVHMHFGNRVSSRAESDHAILKSIFMFRQVISR